MDYVLWLFDNFQRSMKTRFVLKEKMNRKSLSLSVIGDAHRSFWLKLGHLTDSVFRLSTILLGLRQDSKRTVAFYSMAKVLFVCYRSFVRLF